MVPRQPRAGPTGAFTLIELLTVISIIALLASLMLGAVGAVRNQARAQVCGNHLRQTTLAILTYADENDGLTPAGLDLVSYWKNWSWVINDRGLIEDSRFFHCPCTPAANNWWFNSFGFSGRNDPVNLPTLPRKAATIALADSSMSFVAANEAPVIHKTATAWEQFYVCLRHAGRAGAAFFDGHVERLSASGLADAGYVLVHAP